MSVNELFVINACSYFCFYIDRVLYYSNQLLLAKHSQVLSECFMQMEKYIIHKQQLHQSLIMRKLYSWIDLTIMTTIVKY